MKEIPATFADRLFASLLLLCGLAICLLSVGIVLAMPIMALALMGDNPPPLGWLLALSPVILGAGICIIVGAIRIRYSGRTNGRGRALAFVGSVVALASWIGLTALSFRHAVIAVLPVSCAIALVILLTSGGNRADR